MVDTIKEKGCGFMRILVVEDDRLLNSTLCYNLTTAGYLVEAALTKANAIGQTEKERRPDTAVIFLTANDMESDMLKGFELGADDYVTKPFPISVFQKKVSALLSRITRQSGGDFYDDGNLLINFSELTAALAGQVVTFTPLEYRLLKLLTSNSKQVLTRGQLLEKLWDAEENYVDEHALTSAISRIRGKIEVNGYQYIKTVYGMGYMWIGGLKK